MTESTKSKVLLSLIKNVPGLMNAAAVKSLIVDPKNALFSYEDAANALQIVEENPIANLDETAAPIEKGELKKIEERAQDLNISNLFPNAKLAAELTAAKDTERQLFDDFTDAWEKLGEITKKVDTAFGDKVSMVLDEIYTIDGVDKSVVDKVMSMRTTLETINSETVG